MMIGTNLTQVNLHYNTNDLDSTIIEEEIAHDAGATNPQALSKAELVHLIEEAGFEALEQDNLYQTYELLCRRVCSLI